MTSPPSPPVAGADHLLVNQTEPRLITGSCAAGQFGLFSQAAPAKPVNQDSAAVFELSETVCVLAVADGVGGYPRGEDASKIAIEMLQLSLLGAATVQAAHTGILNGFELAHQSIIGLQAGAATTLIVAVVTEESIRTYHAGDSGCLVYGQRGKIKLKTINHSPTGFAELAGQLTETESIMHPARHLVSNLLGVEGMQVEVGEPTRLAKLDTVVVASDGLLDNAMTKTIGDAVRTGRLPAVTERLQQTITQTMAGNPAAGPCKPDDLSVVLYRPRRS
ncbi:MAG: PP2C family protein-serine/threonine phosphatase [Burkholderiaceae bacterium]